MTLSPIHARIHAEYRHASCRLPIPTSGSSAKIDAKQVSGRPFFYRVKSVSPQTVGAKKPALKVHYLKPDLARCSA